MSDSTSETATKLIPPAKLAEFFHAHKSKARARLVVAMYQSQDRGFKVSQCKFTGRQVSFTWGREVDAPSWAIEHDLCHPVDKLFQKVELCFTGSDNLSILLRVYRGHCYNQTDWSTISMRRAVQALQDPAAELTG